MTSPTHALGKPFELHVAFWGAVSNHRRFFQTAIALSVGWLVWQLPTNGLMAENGTQFLGTLTAAVFLWVLRVFDDYLVGLMLLFSWLFLNIVPSQVALSGFSKSSWLFVLSALAIGAAVNKSGVLNRLALKCLHKLSPSYKLCNCMFAMFGLLLAPIVPDIKARLVLLLPLVRAISEQRGLQPCSNGTAGLALAAFGGASQMTCMFLTGATYCLVGWSVLPEFSRQQFNWLTWLVAAFPAGIIFLIFLVGAILISFPLSKSEEKHFAKQSEYADFATTDQPLRGEEWLTLVILNLALLGWVSKPLHGVSESWVAFGAMIVFAAVGILDSKTLKNNVDWPIVLFFGVIFGMGDVIVHLNVDRWLASFLQPIFSATSDHPLTFLSMTLLVVYLLRFFLAKTTTVVLAMFLLTPVSSDIGVHPGVLLITMTLGIEIWILPYQNPAYLIAYSITEGKAFNHAQAHKLMLAKFVASFVALAVSVPYWKYLGLIK